MELSHYISGFFSSITGEAWLFLMFLVVVYSVISFGLHLATKRYTIPFKSLRFLKWFFVLTALYSLEKGLLPRFEIVLPEKLFFFAKAVTLWFVVISFLDGLYAEIYLKKIKQRQVNHIFIDLAKFIFFIILGIVILQSTFDINPGSILTSSAILTAVIGFAMQDTIGSLISGLLIQIEKPFEIGDWIAVATHEGKVVEVSWRYTKIRTISKDYILIPNNSISQDTLVNYNRPIPYVRRDLEIGVDFSVPPVQVKAALMEVLENSSLILKSPRPVVRFMSYGESRMIYRVVFFVGKFEEARRAIDEINTSIWYQFRRQHIEIAYPQREIVIKKQHKHRDETASIVETMKNIELFEGMTDENLELLVRSSYVQRYLEGQIIVKKGSTDTTLFVVLDGRVKVECDGKKLAEIEKGNFFGEMALLTGKPRSADIITQESVRCLVIDREGFRMILARSPRIYKNIQAMFNERMLDRGRKGMLGRKMHVEVGVFERFRQIFMK